MSTFSSFMGGGFKVSQSIVSSNANWTAGNGGLGGSYYIDIPIGTVDVTKSVVRGVYITSTNASFNEKTVSYRFLNASVVRCESWGAQASSPNWYGFVVEEYR